MRPGTAPGDRQAGGPGHPARAALRAAAADAPRHRPRPRGGHRSQGRLHAGPLGARDRLRAADRRRRCSLDEAQLRTLELAGFLHDVGKIGVPESILRKAGPLTDEEYEIVKEHSRIGSGIIRNIEGAEEIAEVVLHHHERWDGKGYPDGLAAGGALAPFADPGRRGRLRRDVFAPAVPRPPRAGEGRSGPSAKRRARNSIRTSPRPCSRPSAKAGFLRPARERRRRSQPMARPDRQPSNADRASGPRSAFRCDQFDERAALG